MASNLLVTLPVIFILSLYLVRDSSELEIGNSICNENDAFDSSFRLANQTFLKTPSGKIWRINETTFYRVGNLSQSHFFAKTPWKTTERMFWIEDFLRETVKINLTSKIFAFSFQFLYGSPLCQKDLQFCKNHDLYHKSYYVCLYGTDKKRDPRISPKTEWRALSYVNSSLSEIPSQLSGLKSSLTEWCNSQSHYLYQMKRTPISADFIANVTAMVECDTSVITGFHSGPLYPSGPLYISDTPLLMSNYFLCRNKKIDNDGQSLEDRPLNDQLFEIFFDLRVRDDGKLNPEYNNILLYDMWAKNKTSLFIPICFAAVPVVWPTCYILSCQNNPCSFSQPLDPNVFAHLGYSKNITEDQVYYKPPKWTQHPMDIHDILQCPPSFIRKKEQRKKALDTNQTDKNMCTQYEKFDSVFQLGKQTFFKTTSGKIWRMYVIPSNVERNQKKYKPKFEAPWQYTERVEHMEKFLVINESYDLTKPIFAFDFQYEYKNQCNYSEPFNYCWQHRPTGSSSYVCIYGVGTYYALDRRVEPYSYDGETLFEIPAPDFYTLRRKVLAFCNFQLTQIYKKSYKCDVQILTGWYTVTPNYATRTMNAYKLTQYNLCRKLNDTDKDILIRTSYDLSNDSSSQEPELLGFGTFPIPKDRASIIIPISVKEKLYILSCETNPCSPSQLLDGNLFYEPTNIVSPNIPLKLLSDDLTIDKIMRCQYEISNQKEKFDPYHFCNQKKFDSEFTLLEDKYFQRQGRFWRYYALGSSNDANPKLKHKVMSIRYDSYMTTLLTKYFDTMQPVIGFTLVIPRHCDMYASTHKYDCPLRKDLQYKLYLTCIVGYNRSGLDYPYTRPFLHTPAGIEQLPKPIFAEHQSHCRNIIHLFRKPGHQWYHVHKDHRYTKIIPQTAVYEAGKIKHKIRFYAEDLKYGKDGTVRGVFLMNYTHKGVTPENKYTDYFYYESYQNSSGSYGKSGAEWYWSEEIQSPQQKIESMVQRIKSEFCGSSLSAETAEMSYSLVTIQNPYKLICNPNIYPYTRTILSFFNIGQYVYVQSEQQFYRYVSVVSDPNVSPYKEGFVYDKQVSELLNDIFDTTEKVTGYSFRYIPNKNHNNATFRVVLIGNPKWYYAKQFNNTVVYRVFKKDLGPYEPLIPLNSLQLADTRYKKMEHPFDTVESCQEWEGSVCKTFTAFSMRKRPNYTTIDGMGYRQINHSIYGHDFDVHENMVPYEESSGNSLTLHPAFLEIFYNKREIYVTRKHNELFERPFNIWKPSQEDQYIIEWANDYTHKVYGLFSYNSTLYFVASGLDRTDPKSEVLQIYEAPDKYDLKNFADGFLNNSRIGNISKLLKCEIRSSEFSNRPQTILIQESHTGSHSSSMVMTFVFICLLAILLVLIIIAGFMAYKNFSSKTNSETKTEDKPSAPSVSQRPSEPSSPVSQQSSETLRTKT